MEVAALADNRLNVLCRYKGVPFRNDSLHRTLSLQRFPPCSSSSHSLALAFATRLRLDRRGSSRARTRGRRHSSDSGTQELLKCAGLLGEEVAHELERLWEIAGCS